MSKKNILNVSNTDISKNILNVSNTDISKNILNVSNTDISKKHSKSGCHSSKNFKF